MKIFDENLKEFPTARASIIDRLSVPPNHPEFVDVDAAPHARSRDIAFRSGHQMFLLYRLWDSLGAALTTKPIDEVDLSEIPDLTASESVTGTKMVFSEHLPAVRWHIYRSMTIVFIIV